MYQKKTEIQRRDSITFYSPVVRMSNYIVSLKRKKQQKMRLIAIVSLIKWPLSSMEDIFKSLNLSDDNEIFRGYTTMIELYNALEFKNYAIFHQNNINV